MDWAAIVAAGVTFVYIKVSDGIGTPDKFRLTHAQAAPAHNLQIGYYHFCRPKTRGGTVQQAAIDEANDTLSYLAARPQADLPLMLDLECEPTLSPADYLLWVHSYIGALPAGTPVVIYTYESYINGKLPADHDLGQYPLWLAHYSITDANKAHCPEGWTKWAIWQFEGEGVLGGNAKIDLDVWNTDIPLTTATPTPQPQPVLKLGDTGPAVITLQTTLNQNGATLTPDGDFGPATLSAVKAFQADNGLVVDGVVGSGTWGKLGG